MKSAEITENMADTEYTAVIISGGTVDPDFASRFLSGYDHSEIPGTDSPERKGTKDRQGQEKPAGQGRRKHAMPAGTAGMKKPEGQNVSTPGPSEPDQNRPAGHVRRPLLIAADRGLLVCEKLGLKPQWLVGDFDTAGQEVLEPYRQDPEVGFRLFRAEKDWTDTEMAAELAMEKGCRDILLLGGTGTRLDHVLGNIQILALALKKGARMTILDPHNRIRLYDRPFTLLKKESFGHYVSFFAYGQDVEGLTLKGFKYEVENFHLGKIGSRAVSNEITAEKARVEFSSGMVLTIESRD